MLIAIVTCGHDGLGGAMTNKIDPCSYLPGESLSLSARLSSSSLCGLSDIIVAARGPAPPGR
jgi:hypothetical protein